MTNYRIIVPETCEKFELLCGRSQLRRMVKLIEGKKIFSKAKTRIAKYHVPEESWKLIKQNPNAWLFRDKPEGVVWIVDKRPYFLKTGEIVFPTEANLEICSFQSFIPENTIVACSDVLKYGGCIYE